MCKFSVGEEVVCVDNKTPVVENPWHQENLLTVGRHYVVLEVEEFLGPTMHPYAESKSLVRGDRSLWARLARGSLPPNQA
jgi:hypothetical protein